MQELIREYLVQLDFITELPYPRIKYVQGDTEACFINFKILINNNVVDLSNKTITITIKKPNVALPSTYQIEEITDNIAKWKLPPSALDTSGTIKCTVEIYEDTKRLTTSIFNYVVIEEFGRNDVNEDEQYPVLTTLIHDMQALEASINTAESGRVEAENNRVSEFNTIKSEVNTAIDNVNSANETLNTSETARQTEYSALKSNMETNINALNTTNTTVQDAEVIREQLKSEMETLKTNVETLEVIVANAESDREAAEQDRVETEGLRVTEFQNMKENINIYNTVDLTVDRNGLTLHPITGGVVPINTLISVNENGDEIPYNYATDMQISNGKIYKKTERGEELEKMFNDLIIINKMGGN